LYFEMFLMRFRLITLDAISVVYIGVFCVVAKHPVAFAGL